MITVIGKKEFIDFFATTMSKYEKYPPNKNISKYYEHSEIKIAIYHTGTITLSGKKEKNAYIKLLSIIKEENYYGMDEVGVGDFIGPVVYVGVHLTTECLEEITKHDLVIKDSKLLKEEEIKHVYHLLKDKTTFDYEIVYDYQLRQPINSLEQKSYYHYLNYQKNDHIFSKVILDLYTTVNNFYKIQQKGFSNFPKDIHLETKADNKYYVVALASIFARAIFLKEIEKINSNSEVKFSLGTNNKVKEQARSYIKVYGIEKFARISKTTFKTFEEVKENLK